MSDSIILDSVIASDTIASEAPIKYEDWDEEHATAAEYQGRKVTLSKPFRTPGKKKKFAVYVKNSSGTVVIVRFGDPNMEIKRDDPKRRKAFRDRHNCSEKKDRTTPGYWSCRQWRSSPVEAEHNCDCGSDCCNDTKVEAAEPSPNNEETHGEYMSRCEEAGYTTEECMAAHEGHTFKEDANYHDEDKMKASEDCCPVGEELIAGTCKPINVTMEITIDDVIAKVEAKTGKSIIEISGIAFHEGMNKNNWSLTRKGAELAVVQMIGADLTLNHPKPSNIGFSRNMDGGVDEAVVGIITEASIEELAEGKWNVRYKAQVQRAELFEALESGLWLRSGYGVSIGGYGVPIKADDDGIVFEEDFTFDHLAIVHKPAYERANIEKVNKIEPLAASNIEENKEIDAISTSTFKYQPESATGQQKGDITMSDEIITEEITASASENESLKADLILAQATIAEYKAIAAKKIEDTRLSLVTQATELGLKGHEDLSSVTIENLIASWEASKPVFEVEEMKPAEPAVASESPSPAKSEAVVANFLNGTIIETPESVYERAFNAWASAWNKTLSGVESNNDRFKAPKYEEIKEMI